MPKPYPGMVIEAAQSFIGTPFRHHFKPLDKCKSGEITLPECMEVGLNESGLDCSGLVIASVCRAIGSKPGEWNPNYRHLIQMRLEYETSDYPSLGDAVIISGHNHVGIVSGEKRFIHA